MCSFYLYLRSIFQLLTINICQIRYYLELGLDVRGRITPCSLMGKGGGDVESMYCLLTFILPGFPFVGKYIVCTYLVHQATNSHSRPKLKVTSQLGYERSFFFVIFLCSLILPLDTQSIYSLAWICNKPGAASAVYKQCYNKISEGSI